jgi:hypothetical protein
MPSNSENTWRNRSLILNDLAEVIYAPQRAFKKIVANPKYLGAVIVFVLFIALSVGFEYSQVNKTYMEQTSPPIGMIFMFNNATAQSGNNLAWRSSSDVTLSNNFGDPLNYTIYIANSGLPPTEPNAYYSLFGNFSLQMSTNNSNSLTAALDIQTDLKSVNETLTAQKLAGLSSLMVDCGTSGFQNLTLVIRQASPQDVPRSVYLKLFSNSDSNYFEYDLSHQFSNASMVGEWNNITLPVGPSNERAWSTNGSPQWNTISAMTLAFNYSSNQTIDFRIGALYFHSLYQTPVQTNSLGILTTFLQLFSLQFLFCWFSLTGLIYLVCRGLKSNVIWKPVFTALGFAMIVMVIRMAINLLATLALPTVYYSFDLSLGVRFDPTIALYYPTDAAATLSAQSQALLAIINSQTAIYHGIVTAMGAISYIWLGGLTGFTLKELKPEFSTVKCFAIAAIGLVITVLLLLFLFNGV